MLKKIACIVICLTGLYWPCVICLADDEKSARAIDPASPSSPDPTPETGSHDNQTPGRAKKIGIAPIPIIFYTPETQLAGGGGVVFTFRDPERPDDMRPDNLQLIAAYTMKNQAFLSLTPEIYFNDKVDKIRIFTSYTNWPSSFFGVGNDTGIHAGDIDKLEEVYTKESFTVQPWIMHKTFSHLSLGITLDVKQSNISDTEEGGQLDGGRLTGSDGGVQSGIGPVLSWDTRDGIFYPTRGSWHKFWSWHYREPLGSDFDYDVVALDLRYYHTIRDGHILALNALGVSTDGEVPFDELPTPPIRGLYEDLFIDEHMVTLQMEYRFPIHDRWSGVAFAAAGNVFHGPDDLDTQDVNYAAGGGIRYAINRKEKINLRFDLGVSSYGVFPYVLFQEAF